MGIGHLVDYCLKQRSTCSHLHSDFMHYSHLDPSRVRVIVDLGNRSEAKRGVHPRVAVWYVKATFLATR